MSAAALMEQQDVHISAIFEQQSAEVVPSGCAASQPLSTEWTQLSQLSCAIDPWQTSFYAAATLMNPVSRGCCIFSS